MVGKGDFSDKIDYIKSFLEILDLEGHQNCMGNFAEWVGFFRLDKVVKLVGGRSVINGAYPV